MTAKVSLVMVVVLGLCAALQYNDPDPLPWIGFYASAAVATLLYRTRWGYALCLVLSAIATAWALQLARAEMEPVAFAQVLQSMQAQTPGIERGREIGGLSLAGVWLATLGIGELLRRRAAETRSRLRSRRGEAET